MEMEKDFYLTTLQMFKKQCKAKIPSICAEDEKAREMWYNNNNLTTQWKQQLMPPWFKYLKHINGQICDHDVAKKI